MLSSRELAKRILLSRLKGFSHSSASASQNWMSPIQSFTIEQSKHNPETYPLNFKLNHEFYFFVSYYLTKSNGRLANVPFSDNSYKWAGGGFVSTVGDLLKFGNIMLYSYQCQPNMTAKDDKQVTYESTLPVTDLPPGYLKPETVGAMWKVVPQTKSKSGSSRSVLNAPLPVFKYN